VQKTYSDFPPRVTHMLVRKDPAKRRRRNSDCAACGEKLSRTTWRPWLVRLRSALSLSSGFRGQVFIFGVLSGAFTEAQCFILLEFRATNQSWSFASAPLTRHFT